MADIVAAVRKACSSRVWSQGVELARVGAVTLESRSEDEVVLRVKVPGRPVANTVVLYPRDAEWDCDCEQSICSAIAAASIMLAQDASGAGVLTTAEAAGGHLVYRFAREAGTLRLSRSIASADGAETAVATTLSALLSNRNASSPAVRPEKYDLAIDSLLGTRPRAPIAADTLLHILNVLADAPHVFLEGRPVRVSREPVVPRAIVRDIKGDVELVLERDPTITELVAVGVARCGDTLRPLGEVALTGPKLEALPLRKRFTMESVGELVSGMLPELSRRIDVDVRTDRLPGVSSSMRPRIAIELESEELGLTVLPTLVYGDPPRARIDGDRLVHLEGTVPIRDVAAERSLVHRLRDELNLMVGRRVRFERAEAVAFAQKLRRWQGELDDNARSAMFQRDPLEAKVQVDGDVLEVRFEVATGDGEVKRAETAVVIRAWRENLDVVPLIGGGFAPLPSEWLAEHGHRVADLLAARDAQGRVATHAIFDLARLCEDLDQPPPASLARLAPLVQDFAGLPEAAVPSDVTATLRPYQRQGLSWLRFLAEAELGGILADDMGLGKTLQAICAVEGRTLVVCPRSLIHNWAEELRKFRPDRSVHIYHGANRVLEQADVTITTYALLRLDLDALTAQRWDCVVLDEAQAIKNPDSGVARAAYQLSGSFRLAVTGTPIENRLEELWSLMHFVNRGLLGGRSDFADRYGKAIASGEPGAAARLRERIRPFVLRRLKREVAPELPPRTDVVLHVDLDDDERAVYDAIRVATRDEVLASLGQGGSVLAALEALLRLRQACCHRGLVPGQEAESSSKVERLVAALEELAADGHKALVFSQWTSLLDRIEPHLQASQIGFVRLDGSTRDRAGVVDSFQSEEGPPVMLISLKAGGVGLNLTAADHVFLCDPWWNPAVEEQAADRAHRIGQDKPVMVYRLVAADSVEERILALQEQKRGIANAALGGADQAAGLTREDLLALLS